MSLNSREVDATSRELTQLRHALSYSDSTLEAALGYEPGTLADALSLNLHPTEVWRLRDFLVALAERDGVPTPAFSRLTDGMRRQARLWFGSWSVPALPAPAA